MDPAYEYEHAQLLGDLRRSGIEVSDIWSWANGSTPFAAEGVLVSYVERVTNERLREGIARALTQKPFQNAVPALLRAFRASTDDSTRWAISSAIAFHGFPRESWSDILALAADARFGRGRQNFVQRLHRIRLPGVESTLLALIDDPDVDAFAVMSLGHCGSPIAYRHLSGVALANRSALFKREVPKALKRLVRRLGVQAH